jgi:hypothetical protein
VALAFACLAHSAVGFVLWGWVRPIEQPSVAQVVPVDLVVDLPLFDPGPAKYAQSPRADPDRPAALPGVMREARRGAAGAPLPAPEALTSPVEPGNAPSGKPDNGAGWSLRVTKVDVGIDGFGRPTQAGQVGTRSEGWGTAGSSRGTSTTGGLAEALEAHDVALGLGRGGVVRSTVEGAVQDSTVMGQGTFDIRIDSSGQVTVSLANASGDADAWGRLSDAIRDGVVSKRGQLRLPPGSRGVDVVVLAEARDKFADGRSPKSLGTRVTGTPGKLTETRDRINITLPSATLVHEGKVCSSGLHVGLDGVSILGGCSPENAGTSPKRMVAARVVSESQL